MGIGEMGFEVGPCFYADGLAVQSLAYLENMPVLVMIILPVLMR